MRKVGAEEESASLHGWAGCPWAFDISGQELIRNQELMALKFCSQVKVRRLKMRSRGDRSSSKPPAETCTPSARVQGWVKPPVLVPRHFSFE